MHGVTRVLTEHYDACLAKHGPTPQGMDWGGDSSRLDLRFDALIRAIGLNVPDSSATILDAGCGCGLFLDHLQQRCAGRFEYVGLDASAKMIDAARRRHPSAHWMVGDITTSANLPAADWVVANGLLTERRETSEPQMLEFAKTVVASMFECCRAGIVFNVLTSHVNFRNPMLFYWDPGDIITFASRGLSRHVTIYQDLSIYDVFCCIRKTPWSGPAHAKP
jgi:SAM-dependent methyltransferase